MLELTGLTHPGPFLSRTIEMGRYLGIFDGKRLVAMTGERMSLPGFTDVSGGSARIRIIRDARFLPRRWFRRSRAASSRGGLTPFLPVRGEQCGGDRRLMKSSASACEREMNFTGIEAPG
jgi:hypothetical protein